MPPHIKKKRKKEITSSGIDIVHMYLDYPETGFELVKCAKVNVWIRIIQPLLKWFLCKYKYHILYMYLLHECHSFLHLLKSVRAMWISQNNFYYCQGAKPLSTKRSSYGAILMLPSTHPPLAFHWLPFILTSLWQRITLHLKCLKTLFVHCLFLKKHDNV